MAEPWHKAEIPSIVNYHYCNGSLVFNKPSHAELSTMLWWHDTYWDDNLRSTVPGGFYCVECIPLTRDEDKPNLASEIYRRIYGSREIKDGIAKANEGKNWMRW